MPPSPTVTLHPASKSTKGCSTDAKLASVNAPKNTNRCAPPEHAGAPGTRFVPRAAQKTSVRPPAPRSCTHSGAHVLATLASGKNALDITSTTTSVVKFTKSPLSHDRIVGVLPKPAPFVATSAKEPSARRPTNGSRIAVPDTVVERTGAPALSSVQAKPSSDAA